MKNLGGGLLPNRGVAHHKAKHSSFLIRNREFDIQEPRLNNFLEEPDPTNDYTEPKQAVAVTDGSLKDIFQNELRTKPFTRIPIKNSSMVPISNVQNHLRLEKQKEVEEDIFKYLAQTKKKKKRPRPPTILIASSEGSLLDVNKFESSNLLRHSFRDNSIFIDKNRPIMAEILDIFKVEEFPEVDTYPKDEIILHKKLMRKDRIKDPYFLELEERITLNSVIFRTVMFYDKGHFLKIRRLFFFIQELIAWISNRLIMSKLFTMVSFAIIIFSCYILTKLIYDRKNQNLLILDSFCFIYFWFEIFLKLNVFGLSRFLRDEFNILDLIIQISTLIIDYLLPDSDMNFASFRILRVLRFPLKDLQNMLSAFFSSLRLLFEGLIIMLFVISLYSVAGIHIFSGLLDQRCFNKFTGKVHESKMFCGNVKCPGDDYICGWTLLPGELSDGSNFDNFLNSTIQVLRIMTLNDWTSIMYKIQRTFTNYSWVYFISLILIGNYFLMNLLLALLKIKYTQINIKIRGRDDGQKKLRKYNIKSLREKGLYTPNQEKQKAIEDFGFWYFFRGVDESIKVKNETHIRSMVKEALYKFSKEVNETKSLENTRVLGSTSHANSKMNSKLAANTNNNFNSISSHKHGSKSNSSPMTTLSPSIFKRKQKDYFDFLPPHMIKFENDHLINDPGEIMEAKNEVSSKPCSLERIPHVEEFPRDGLSHFNEISIFHDNEQDSDRLKKNPSEQILSPISLGVSNLNHNHMNRNTESPSLDEKISETDSKKSFEHKNFDEINIPREVPYSLENQNITELADLTKKESGKSIKRRTETKKISLKTLKESIIKNMSHLNMRTFKRSLVDMFKIFVSIPVRLTHFRKKKKRFQRINQLRYKNLEIRVKVEAAYESSSTLEVLPNKEEKDLLRFIEKQQNLARQKKFKLDYSNYMEHLKISNDLQMGEENRNQEATSFGDTIKSLEKTLGGGWDNIKTIGKRLPVKQKKRVFQRNNEIVMNLSPIARSGGYSPSKKSSNHKTFLLGVMNKLVARSQPREKERKHTKRVTGPVKKIVNQEERLSKLNYTSAKELMMLKIENNPPDMKKEFNNEETYADIISEDLKSKKIGRHVWSGMEILSLAKKKNKLILDALSVIEKDIWRKGIHGLFNMVVRVVQRIIKNPIFIYAGLILVILNTLFMASEGIVKETTYDYTYKWINTAFFVEFTLKVIGYSVTEYKNVGNFYLDSLINVYAISDIILWTTPYSFSLNLRYYRLLKIILLLRIFRVLKYLEFLKFILIVIKTTFSSFIYIAVSLLLLICAFALMGMQIFHKQIQYENIDAKYEKSFDYFSTAFMSVFQIISLDDWHLLYQLSYNRISHLTVFLFLTFLIVMGSFILLNLFIANMLDGFEFVSEMDANTLENLYGESKEEANSRAENKQTDKHLTTALSTFEKSQFINKPSISDTVISRSQKLINSTIPYKKNLDELTSSSSEDASEGEQLSNMSNGRGDSPRRRKKLRSPGDSPTNMRNSTQNKSSLTKKLLNSIINLQYDLTEKEGQNNAGIKIFKDVDEEFSLFTFSKTNKLRIFCKLLSDSEIFRRFINFFILISSIKLAFDTFIDWDSDKDDYPLMRQVSYIFNIIVNVIFFCEAMFKIISFGFLFGENSYLRDFQNIIEFSVIVAFTVDLFTIQEQFNIVKAIALLRMIRPINYLYYRSKSIQIVFASIIESFYEIFNALLIVFTVWVLYAIIGVSIYRGRFGYCQSLDNFGVTKIECERQNKSWLIYKYNFDTIYEAFLTLLVTGTFDHWSEILDVAVNSSLDNGPIRFNNQWSSYVYFMSFIIVGTWFFLNLFVGVIFTNYTIASKKSKHKYLSEDQERWVELAKMIFRIRPFEYSAPKTGIKRKLYDFFQGKLFDSIIMICLFINFFHLAIYYEGSSSEFETNLRRVSFFLTFVFTMEAGFKMYCYTVRGYFYYSWHKLEFTILCVYFMNAYFDLFYDDIKLQYGATMVRSLGMLKVLGQVRLLIKLNSLQLFLRTLSFSMPLIFNILFLIIIIIFIYSVFGCFLFRNVTKGEIIDDYVNFKNFLFGMMTLFRCSTGEDWSRIMKDCGKTPPDCSPGECGSQFSHLFFISFILITHYIFMNMFVLILLQQFEESYKSELNPVNLISQIYQFKFAWGQYCELKHQKENIHISKIVEFFKHLGYPLGCQKSDSFFQVGRKILHMNIPANQKGLISFGELLYTTLKNHYYHTVFWTGTARSRRYLKKIENEFYFSVERKKNILNNLEQNSGNMNKRKQAMVFNIVEQIRITNPFYSYFFAYFILRCWKEYATQIRLKAKHIIKRGQHLSSLSSSSSDSYSSASDESEKESDKLSEIKEED